MDKMDRRGVSTGVSTMSSNFQVVLPRFFKFLKIG